MERGNYFFLTELLFLTVKLSCDALFWLPVMPFISLFFFKYGYEAMHTENKRTV